MVRGRTGTKLALFFKRRQKTSGKLLICLVCPPCYPHSVSHRPLTEHIPSLSPVSGFLLQTYGFSDAGFEKANAAAAARGNLSAMPVGDSAPAGCAGRLLRATYVPRDCVGGGGTV